MSDSKREGIWWWPGAGRVRWCEDCQDWFEVDIYGEIECFCNPSFQIDSDEELDFN